MFNYMISRVFVSICQHAQCMEGEISAHDDDVERENEWNLSYSGMFSNSFPARFPFSNLKYHLKLHYVLFTIPVS